MSLRRLNISSALYVLCVFFLAVLVAWVYWPGIQGPELLDDRSSILVIEDLENNRERAWDYVIGG